MEIKRIVFDLDNTLTPFIDRYKLTINETLDELGIDYSDKDIEILRMLPNIYGNYYRYFDKVDYYILIKSSLNIYIPYEFVDLWLDKLGFCVPNYPDIKVDQTLNYLSEKYELAVFTDWFGESQKNRLIHMNILKYFKEVISTDIVPVKPNLEGFRRACGGHLPSECIMVGDDIYKDINGAKSIGMDTYLVDYHNKHYDYEGNKINHIKELRKIL